MFKEHVKERARKLHDAVTEHAREHNRRVVVYEMDIHQPMPAPRIGDWTVMNDHAMVIVEDSNGTDPTDVMSSGPTFGSLMSELTEPLPIKVTDAGEIVNTTESKPNGKR